MHKFAVLAAALALTLPAEVLAQTTAQSSAGPSPYTATRTGSRPRNARVAHCTVKADAIRLQDGARAIYMRKCVSG